MSLQCYTVVRSPAPYVNTFLCRSRSCSSEQFGTVERGQQYSDEPTFHFWAHDSLSTVLLCLTMVLHAAVTELQRLRSGQSPLISHESCIQQRSLRLLREPHEVCEYCQHELRQLGTGQMYIYSNIGTGRHHSDLQAVPTVHQESFREYL